MSHLYFFFCISLNEQFNILRQLEESKRLASDLKSASDELVTTNAAQSHDIVAKESLIDNLEKYTFYLFHFYFVSLVHFIQRT